jgi:hypothetical protein
MADRADSLARMPTDWTRPHLRFLAEDKTDRPEYSSSVSESDGKRHRATDYLPGEDRRMNNPPLDRIRIDIVRTRDRKPSLSIRDYAAFRVAECAADVHVGRCVGDEARIVATPCAGDVGDRRTCARAGDCDCRCDYKRDLDRPGSHT